jgi:hypothetical protein
VRHDKGKALIEHAIVLNGSIRIFQAANSLHGLIVDPDGEHVVVSVGVSLSMN